MLDSDSDFRILRALHNFSEGKKRRKKVTLGSHFYTSTSLWVVLCLSTLYVKTVDWSLTTRIKHWERNVVLGWAGDCGEGRNTSSPKNACVEGYDTVSSEEKIRVLLAGVETTTSWLLVQMLYHWATRDLWKLRPLTQVQVTNILHTAGCGPVHLVIYAVAMVTASNVIVVYLD